jgi:hypothetical protein
MAIGNRGIGNGERLLEFGFSFLEFPVDLLMNVK